MPAQCTGRANASRLDQVRLDDPGTDRLKRCRSATSPWKKMRRGVARDAEETTGRNTWGQLVWAGWRGGAQLFRKVGLPGRRGERERRERETGRGQLEGYLIAPPSTWRQTSAEPFDFVYKLQVR